MKNLLLPILVSFEIGGTNLQKPSFQQLYKYPCLHNSFILICCLLALALLLVVALIWLSEKLSKPQKIILTIVTTVFVACLCALIVYLAGLTTIVAV